MTKVTTVKELAKVVDTPVDRLLLHIRDAGLPHTNADQIITDREKHVLLSHLKGYHDNNKYYNPAPSKIIMQRKTTTTLRVAGSKTVSVEVRKKKTYIKRPPVIQGEKKIKDHLNLSISNLNPVPNKKILVPTKSNNLIKEDSIRVSKKIEDRRNKKKLNKNYFIDTADNIPHIKGFKPRIKKRNQHGFQNPQGPVIREINISETITIAELGSQMSVKVADLVKFMFQHLGTPVTINQVIDQETAQLVAEEFGHKVKLVRENALEEELVASLDEFKGDRIKRSPVVTVMGHVDHGKTSLLDYIRRTKVTELEVGGITQHIGAYHVETNKGMVTFLDTPGHSAFTAMRSRGAKLTDIIILVIAADDSVMPQTEEAINHAKSASVPIVVAVNKIDKEEADIDRVKHDLASHDLIPEEWGGDVQCIPISAKNGTGIDQLLEAILLQADMLELQATPSGPGRGVIIESFIDKHRGPVATVLIQNGTLHQGDVFLCGIYYGRIRSMLDERRNIIKEAGPSIPVEIVGIDGSPEAGNELTVVYDEKKAKEIALLRQSKCRDKKLSQKSSSTRDNMFENVKNEKKIFNIVLKSDVRGSLEALTSALYTQGNDEVQLRIVSGGIGWITESDAHLALASNAVLFGFNVRADASASKIIDKEGLEIRYYNVIYDMISDVQNALRGMLGIDIKETIIGIAEVRTVFSSPKVGAIAGCMVIEGIVNRKMAIRVLRNNIVMYEGECDSLRRFKDDVLEVRAGMECGIVIKSYNNINVGDKLEIFDKIEIARSL